MTKGRWCRSPRPRRRGGPRLRGAVFFAAALAASLRLAPAAAAQQASLQGVATSASTGGPVEGVEVVLVADGRALHATTTDRNGFYQIGGIAPGSYELRGGLVGHLPHVRQVTFSLGGRVTASFELEESPVTLEGVVISGQRGATDRDLGRQRVTPADLSLVPVPAGAGDLANYLQTLPGVTTTGDRGGQLFVRGGTSAENLVLVDGIPIYQPFHIVGFFSVFPEDVVSSVDFYAGGFGARYSGRTSSVIDVALRDGQRDGYHATGSVSPFLAEVTAEGPVREGISWLASLRRSLLEEAGEAFTGTPQPLTFDSQLLKLSVIASDDLRCSALALRTFDRGRLDPVETTSYVSWKNRLFGGRCVNQFDRGLLRFLEVNFNFSMVDNAAVSRGSSNFRADLWRMHHDAHFTTMVRSLPVYTGYYGYIELANHDLAELFGSDEEDEDLLAFGGYAEVALPLGGRAELRPGVVLTASPSPGVEPRLRASWEPFGRSSEKVQGAIGLYRQDIAGITDMRDVGSVFTAWTRLPGVSTEAMHAILGWQQALGGGLSWSLDGYYKKVKDVPVPVWRGVARFTTTLASADGTVYGVDARAEYNRPRFFGFVGYGSGWIEYETSQAGFSTWFGEPVQRYHPPHDRRHQVNALGRLDLGPVAASLRWQLGTGLPFTRPLGFDEAFDFSKDLHDVSRAIGTSRLVLDKPFTARLPIMHRLDLSVEGGIDLPIGRLTGQVGAINAYDRRNMFYYDLFAGRRVDQLPLTPYASLTLRSGLPVSR